MFCDGYVDTFISVYNSALCFIGGLGTDPNVPIWGSHVPDYIKFTYKPSYVYDYMEKENVLFLYEMMGYNLTVRETQDYTD